MLQVVVLPQKSIIEKLYRSRNENKAQLISTTSFILKKRGEREG